MQADEDVGKVAQVTPVAICTPLSTPSSPPLHTPPVRGFVGVVGWMADLCSEGVGVVYGSDY